MARRRTQPRPLRPPREQPTPPPGPPPVSPDASAYLAAWLSLQIDTPGRPPEHRRIAAVAGLDHVDSHAARAELLAAGWLRRSPGQPPWLPIQAACWLVAGDLFALVLACAALETPPDPRGHLAICRTARMLRRRLLGWLGRGAPGRLEGLTGRRSWLTDAESVSD